MQLNESKLSNADEFAKIFHISTDAMGGRADDTASLAKLAAIPLMAVIQCALNRDFLLEREKGHLYWAFDTKELLKGDMGARFAAYKTALDANFMQIDEVRYAEDLEPLGLSWIKLGLQDVLYDPKSQTIYTPNTNQTGTMAEGGLQPAPKDSAIEPRAGNPNHGPDGRFTSGSGKGLTSSDSSGTMKSSAKPIGKNGGTLKAEDLPKIKISNGIYAKADVGTTIRRIHSFAGKGTKSPLRIENEMIKQFGGKKGEWQHTTGDVTITRNGVTKTAEVHWFQEPSVGIVRPNVKRWR